MDLVVNSRRMPMPGETVSGHTFSTVPGGKGANQAVAAARLGCDVTMIGCVGDDEFGRVLKRGLANEGIDTRTVKSVAGMASGVALIQVDENGENAITMNFNPGASWLRRLGLLSVGVASGLRLLASFASPTLLTSGSRWTTFV